MTKIGLVEEEVTLAGWRAKICPGGSGEDGLLEKERGWKIWGRFLCACGWRVVLG
jgi:hypothetical protein